MFFPHRFARLASGIWALELCAGRDAAGCKIGVPEAHGEPLGFPKGSRIQIWMRSIHSICLSDERFEFIRFNTHTLCPRQRLLGVSLS